MGVRVIAVDWSGAQAGAHHKIWLAEVIDGRLVRLESGRGREMLTDHLIEQAQADPHLIVGLDFAFSLPAWFLEQRGLTSAHELWALADREADQWLAACESPFWGRPGIPRWPGLPHHFRQTELAVPKIAGIQPKSVFQVGGAGAVGTGSLRGMRTLHRLHAAGFSIWPFDPPRLPLVVEIYPRLLTGPVVKTNVTQRAAYLAARYPDLDVGLSALAASSDDAFDAAVSALVMAQHIGALTRLPTGTDGKTALEGLIWHPHMLVSIAGGKATEADQDRGRVSDPSHPDYQPPGDGEYDPSYPGHHPKPYPADDESGDYTDPDGTVYDIPTGRVIQKGSD